MGAQSVKPLNWKETITEYHQGTKQGEEKTGK